MLKAVLLCSGCPKDSSDWPPHGQDMVRAATRVSVTSYSHIINQYGYQITPAKPSTAFGFGQGVAGCP